jgi:predicted  nucleic acid-binding Zn-ribbon protein
VLTDDLLELQRVDTAGDQLAHRRSTLPERDAVAGATAEAERNRKAIAGLLARQRELADVIETAERDGAALTKKRERLEAQLRTIISPREAEALMHELATLAAERDALDDRELEALEEQSTIVDELAAAHAAEPDLDRRAADTTAALAVVESEIDRESAELVKARAEIAAHLAGGVLADYERRRARFGGVAVAHLEGRRCSGCHLDLSTSELEQVRSTPPGELADCPQCGRILLA